MNYKESTYLWSRQTLKNINTFFYSLGFFIFASGLYLFITYRDPATPLRDLKPIAHIKKIEENPKRKIVGSLSWFKLTNNEDLFQGDRIITNTQDKVVVQFIDDTLLDIAPNSLVVIDYRPNEISLKLERGSIKVKPNAKKSLKLIKGKERYHIKALNTGAKPLAPIDIRSTSKGLDLSSEKQGQYSLTSADGKSQNLKSTVNDFTENNFKTKTSYTIGVDKSLPLKLTNNRLDKSIPSERIQKTHFALNRIESGKITQRNPITLDPKVMGTKNFQQNLPLPAPGEYSLVQIDQKGQETELRRFKVMGPPILRFTSAQTDPQIVADYNQQSPIRWQEAANKRYRFTLETLPLEFQQSQNLAAERSIIKSTFDQVMDKDPKQIGHQELKLDKNDYSYRVTQNAIIRYQVKIDMPQAPWSPWIYRKVTLKNPLPIDHEKTPAIYIKDQENPFLYLALKTKPGRELVFEIGRDPKLTDVVLKRKTRRNYIKTAFIVPGFYFWRAKTADDKLRTPPLPLTVKASVVDGEFKKDEVFESYDEPATVMLNWKERLVGTTYHLILKQGKKTLLNKEFKGKKYKITLPRFGKYSWELSASGDKDALLLPIHQSIEFKLPKCVAPNVPEQQIIEYTEIKKKYGYRINLPTRPDIIKWELEVFTKTPSGADKVISRKLLSKNYTFWVSNKSGKYYYRIKIIDKWNRKSPYSNTGLLVFPISPLLEL